MLPIPLWQLIEETLKGASTSDLESVGNGWKREWRVMYGRVTWLLGVSDGPVSASRLSPTCVESSQVLLGESR